MRCARFQRHGDAGCSQGFFPARLGAEGSSRHSDRNRGTCTVVCHRQKVGCQFKRGEFSTCASPRPGRHKTVTTPEVIDQIHELILADSRISAKSIAELLGISRGRVRPIIHEDADVPREVGLEIPERGSKLLRFQSSEQLLECFRLEPSDFLSRLVTMEETPLYHYDTDSETKQQ